MTRQGWQNKAKAAALALLVSALAAPAFAQSSGNADAADSVPSDVDLAGTRCTSGEEKFLPGDYYYCLGTQTYGLGRYESSQRFFKTAASWASKPAQYVLGIMALNGDHQPVNRPLALAWLALASERPNSSFRLAYETANKAASEQDRQAAEKLLASMRPTYGDATAARRAERRYASGMADLVRLSRNGGSYCMAGMGGTARPDMEATTDPNSCPPAQMMVKALDAAAVNVFDGWEGHVQVGDLQQVGTPTEQH